MEKKHVKKLGRYSVSMSGRTYDRVRSAVPSGGMASFVDDIVMKALEDPTILARMVAKCRQDPA